MNANDADGDLQTNETAAIGCMFGVFVIGFITGAITIALALTYG